MASPTARKGRRRIWVQDRIWGLGLIVFILMAFTAPGFLSLANFSAILKGASLDAIVAIGFTIALINGKLDLSIGTTLTLAAMLTVGLQPSMGWGGSLIVALAAGLAVGAVNGLLVSGARVDAFIATLGTMSVTQGIVFKLCRGGTFAVQDFEMGRWLERPMLAIFSPKVLIAVALVLFFEAILKKTRVGRGFYLVGGNPSAAWHAGLSVDRYVIAGYGLSGLLSSLAGGLYGMSVSSAMPTMGNNSLMRVIAAAIVGGASMSGGQGSVVNSLVALLSLAMLFNGFSCMGAGWEAQKIAAGAVLAGVIVVDAIMALKAARRRGQRRELLEELEHLGSQRGSDWAEDEEGRSDMDRRDSMILAITGTCAVACVAIVAIFAMYFLHVRTLSSGARPVLALGQAAPQAQGERVSGPSGRVAESPDSETIDLSGLKSVDGQPLLFPPEPKTIPLRPEDPSKFSEEEDLHWYDMEYAGWNIPKVNIPLSPMNGPKGKRVIYLKFVDHPYCTAMSRGMQKVADASGIQLKTMVANNDISIQSQQVDQCINEKPDLVIINPVDAKACVALLRKLNEAGIPTIASNLLPVSEGMQYVLSWTGPDDWGQFRELAKDFAKRMNYEGGYCIVRHFPGGSPYFSRTFAVITELKKIAPKMKLLAMQPTELDAEKSLQVMSDWLTLYGQELKGIVSADDSGAMIGINEAVKNAHREDIIRVAAGNSKVGMDFVKAGALHTITYQSPEADGALPMALAADWFSGKQIPEIRYLPIRLITKENVDHYLPAQW